MEGNQDLALEDLNRNGAPETPLDSMVSSTSSSGKDKYSAPDSVPASWGTLLKEFANDTTLHGVRYFALGSPRFVVVRRLCWFALLTTAIVVFIFYAVERATEYLKYRTTSSVQENYVDSMSFPAISICNQNPFRLTAASDGGWYPVARELTQKHEAYTARLCYEDEFRCANQDCIPLVYRCDSFPDCSDLSDETTCNPCPRLTITSSSNSLFLPHLIGRTYSHQENTFRNDLVYIGPGRTRDEDMMYLYQDTDRGRWQFGYNTGSVLAYAEGKAATPQDVSTLWVLHTGERVAMNFFCAGPGISSAVNLGPPDGSLNLKHVYDTGAQPLENMLIDCYWKGSPCGVESFTRVYTDMGVCYSFDRQHLQVEEAGPGNGMTVTLNIEQYDYTSDPADGSGVQILMHDPADVPIMAAGLAISPGLFSMVALERTQVDNLGPPWGNCSSKDLDYYDLYSVNTCVMNCKMKLAEELCGCLDINMPNTGTYPYCTVQEYVECILVKLDQQTITRECVCGTPCANTVYVPSLSFASISTDESSINTQDAITAHMQRRLASAREVSYRVDANKYRDTTRILNIVHGDFAKILWFIEVLQQDVTKLTTHAMACAVDAATDCTLLNARQDRQMEELRGVTLRSIQHFINFYRSTTYGSLIGFRDVLSDISEPFTDAEKTVVSSHEGWLQFNQGRATVEFTQATMVIRNISLWQELLNDSLYDVFFDILSTDSTLRTTNASIVLPDIPFWNETTEAWLRFASLHDSYHRTLSAINATLGSQFVDLENGIYAMEDLGYSLRKDIITPLLPTFRVHCDWCYTSDNASLVSIVKSKLLDYMSSILYPTLQVVSETVDDIYRRYMIAYATKDNVTRAQIINEDLNDMITLTEQVYIDIEDNLYDVIMTSSAFVAEVLRLASPRCEDALARSQNELHISQQRIQTIVKEVHDYINTADESFRNDSMSYIDLKATLTDLSKHVAFPEMLAYVQPRIATGQDLLRTMESDIEAMEIRINSVFYWVIMQWNDTYISHMSSYWSRFNMTTSTVEIPDIQPRVGDFLSQELFSMKGNRQNTDAYIKNRDTISRMVFNMEHHYVSLSQSVTEADKYFQQFLKANNINEEFYAKNILQMDVFYKSLTDKTVVQQRAYEYPTLLGEVGGLMGLLLGASCITVFELLDLVLFNCCLRIWNRKPNKPKKSSRKNPVRYTIGSSTTRTQNANNTCHTNTTQNAV